MTKRNNKDRRIIRSDLSGKAVNGKDVILTSEAEEYLKVNGYKVISPAKISLAVTSLLSFIMLGGLFII
jgi:hypothetical protein